MEGFNCYDVSNEQELIELTNNSNNIDPTAIIHNSKNYWLE
ncbi:MAG TPA: hypothetical protein VF242_12545 [Nitrososphaeraceae archaeon]